MDLGKLLVRERRTEVRVLAAHKLQKLDVPHNLPDAPACRWATDVAQAQIYTYVLNRGPLAVVGPLDVLGAPGLSRIRYLGAGLPKSRQNKSLRSECSSAPEHAFESCRIGRSS